MSQTTASGSSTESASEDDTSRGEVYVLSRDAIRVLNGRREELKTLVEDALEHLDVDDSRARREVVRLLFNRVCEAFQLEKVRVFVEVIRDDCYLPPRCERWRREEACKFLDASIWRSLSNLVIYDEWEKEPELFSSSTTWASLRTSELEGFQCAVYTRLLCYFAMGTEPDPSVMLRQVFTVETLEWR